MARSAMIAAGLVLCCAAGEAAAREASADEAQPGARDTVHTLWLNGPTHSSKLGGGWPSFGTGGSTSGQCDVGSLGDAFTGYNTNGQYCMKASPALDEQPQLLIHSGRVGVVVDVGGAEAGSSVANLFPKLGPVPATIPTDQDTLTPLSGALCPSTTRVLPWYPPLRSAFDGTVWPGSVGIH